MHGMETLVIPKRLFAHNILEYFICSKNVEYILFILFICSWDMGYGSNQKWIFERWKKLFRKKLKKVGKGDGRAV